MGTKNPYLFKPDRHSSHMKIISYLRNIDAKLRILDVGCSNGFIGKQLGKKHEFYGIDISGKDAAIARKYYKKVRVANIDSKKQIYNEGFFDVIIMADVLEHLKDPLGALLNFKRLLKKNGLVIISVPNVANIYVRLKLLLGNFDYEERGILDKTHTKFFTLKSFRNFIRESGLVIEKEDATPIPLPSINPVFSEGGLLSLLHESSYLSARAWKTMFSFQLIAYCRNI